tara:strand:+ start:7729 stop:8007 length:279 start_codon:yes stop_codon:yes gene_type:complete
MNWQDQILTDHKEQTGFFEEIENEKQKLEVMENLTKKQWKRVFEVMLKEARNQKRIIDSRNIESRNLGGRPEALKMANDIKKIALINAGWNT